MRGTTKRNIRINDELWEAALAKADKERREGGVSEVCRELLTRWVARPARKPKAVR